ncbi:MAG: L-threonylcarbamoyladenylate synthase [Actinobacteria bacterium]|nr:L-threonylcarbamoyladenylate synthase [Actinomycetota bacterium]
MVIISNCTQSAITDAAKSLVSGNLVAFPTETVYGLGADASNESAVNKIYKAKGRPADHPLIVHISNINLLDKWAKDVPEYAIKLARSFWPGPMTLILPRTALVKDFVTGGQDNVGIRIPNQTLALALLSEFEKQGGAGVAAPSANRFGAVSPTTAGAVEAELAAYLSGDDQILDGGACDVGVESTIIDCTGSTPIILRPGAITAQMIFAATDLEPATTNNLDIKASGLLESHYSPLAKVILDRTPERGDGFIALSNIKTPEGVIRLASPKNNEEYAKVLYQALRNADSQQIKTVHAHLPVGSDIAVAIRDRLTKSANK